MPVPSVSSSASDAPRAAPARGSASSAQFASLSTPTGRPEPLAHQSRNGKPSSGRCTHPPTRARPRDPQRRDPEAHRVGLGRRRARLLDGLDHGVEHVPALGRLRHSRCTRWCTASPSSTTPPSSFVPPASNPITRLRPSPDDIHRGCRPAARRPAGVQGLSLGRGLLDGLQASRPGPQLREAARRRASASAATSRSPASRADPPAALAADPQVARFRASVAWLLLSLVLFFVSAGSRRRVRRDRGGALERRQPAHRQHDPRARLRQAPEGHRAGCRRPGPRRRSCSCTSAFGSVRKLSILRDRRPRSPATAAEDQRRVRARRRRADDRDGRELPRATGSRSTTSSRSTSRTSPS